MSTEVSPLDAARARVEIGRQAKIMLEYGAEDMLSRRQAELIDTMVREFRAGELTEDASLRLVACLSEIRALHERLLHDVRQGERALTAINATAQTN